MTCVEVSGKIPFGSLRSRVEDTRLSASSRVDPYWDDLWSAGSQFHWSDVSALRAQERAGLAWLPHRMRLSDSEVEDVLRSFRYERLSALAVIDSWRTLTGELLAGFTGCARFLNPDDRVLSALFHAGVLELGAYATPFGMSESARRRLGLFRPAKGQAFERRIAPMLTDTELVFATGGYPWMSSGTYDRHNMLNAELALRVGEWLPNVGTVLGEKHALYSLVSSSVVPGVVREHVESNIAQRRADSVIVRADGLRVAVELTANPSPVLAKKVAHWCGVLNSSPLGESGLMVVFVSASNRQKVSGDIDRKIRHIIAREASRFPVEVRSRIGWVHWADWFPGRGFVSPEFMGLTVASPSGRGSDVWECVRVLDPEDFVFEPRDVAGARSVVRASTLVGSVPFMVRERIRRAEPEASVRMRTRVPVADALRADRAREVVPFGVSPSSDSSISVPPLLSVPERV